MGGKEGGRTLKGEQKTLWFFGVFFEAPKPGDCLTLGAPALSKTTTCNLDSAVDEWKCVAAMLSEVKG